MLPTLFAVHGTQSLLAALPLAVIKLLTSERIVTLVVLTPGCASETAPSDAVTDKLTLTSTKLATTETH